MPESKTWRYFTIASVLFVLDWGLGVARLYWPEVNSLFIGLNFPTALGFVWLEGQPTAWWHEHAGRFVNDEIGQGAAFCVMVALQAVIYFAMFELWWRPERNAGPAGARGWILS